MPDVSSSGVGEFGGTDIVGLIGVPIVSIDDIVQEGIVSLAGFVGGDPLVDPVDVGNFDSLSGVIAVNDTPEEPIEFLFYFLNPLGAGGAQGLVTGGFRRFWYKSPTVEFGFQFSIPCLGRYVAIRASGNGFWGADANQIHVWGDNRKQRYLEPPQNPLTVHSVNNVANGTFTAYQQFQYHGCGQVGIGVISNVVGHVGACVEMLVNYSPETWSTVVENGVAVGASGRAWFSASLPLGVFRTRMYNGTGALSNLTMVVSTRDGIR